MYVGVLAVRSEDSQVTAEAIDRENTIVMPLLQMLGFYTRYMYIHFRVD